MILTDDEITAHWLEFDSFNADAIKFARAIEAAILAKIGDPVGNFWHNGNGLWHQDTPQFRIKGITQPLYRLPEVKE